MKQEDRKRTSKQQPKGRKRSSKKGQGVLVNDIRGLYTANLADQEIPPGWRVSLERQRVFVLQNYSYILPYLAQESSNDHTNRTPE